MGCEVLKGVADGLPTTTKKIPGVRPPENAVCLDIVLVERPKGDSLLGSQLWDRVDQLHSLEAESRDGLRENGFRLGVVGTNPPRALQQLLGEHPEFLYEESAERAKQSSGHRLFVRSGGNVKIAATPRLETCDLCVERDGEEQTLSLSDAEGRFRLQVEQLESGWVKLTFVPQVYHGPNHLRYVADKEWRLEDSQRVETFFQQRFSLILGQGEMVVLAADGPDSHRLGQLFFTGKGTPRSKEDGEDPPEVERILVVRVTATGRLGL